MADILKSAIGLFTSSGSSSDNEFVGQNVEVGQYKLRIRRVIAEGGYAIVYHSVDLTTGKEYALKRMFASEESAHKSITAEITLLKRVASHASCIRFIAASSNELQGRTEYLLLTEYCPGALVDFCRLHQLVLEQIILCFHQVCLAVQTLHHQQPPIAHRDLKLENVLIGGDGRLRLCDFGSASQKHLYPDEQWTASQRSITEDDLARFTTPMYRAPEMLDLYSNMPINQQVDIWALGCLLFLFCFQRHPFEDSAKLRIINAKYTIPEDQLQYAIFHELIRSMLRINPTERPTIDEVVTLIEQLAAARRVDLKASLPVPASAMSAAPMPASSSAQSSSLFSSIKGGANQLFRGIKSTSTKVMDQVYNATAQQPVGAAEPPSYILPRILVSGHPEARFEDFKRWLESRHGPTFAVWNLSEKTYPSGRLCEGHVSECGWQPARAPNLDTLYHICDNVLAWLRAGPQNVALLHCLDGRASSAVAFAALTQFTKLFKSPESAMNVFAVRRHSPSVTPSQRRYLHYVRDIVWHDVRPHACAVRLVSVSMQPVPTLNRNRTGCTPFIEVHMGERRIASTGLVEYEALRQHTVDEPSVTIPLEGGVTFPPGADITITLFHARSTLGSKMQGRLTGVKVCSVQFNTGMIEPTTRRLVFGRMELDCVDAPPDRVPDTFRIAVELEIAPKEHLERRSAWCNYSDHHADAHLLFKDDDEMKGLLREFGDEKEGKTEGRSTFFTDSAPHPPARPPPPSQARQPQQQPQQPQPQPQQQPQPAKAAFFETLSWGQEEGEPLREDMSDEGSDYEEPAPGPARGSAHEAVLLNFGESQLDDEGYEEEMHPPHQEPQKAALLDLDFDAGEPAPPIKPSPVPGFATDPFALFGGVAQPSGWPSGKTSPQPMAGSESPSKSELEDLLNFEAGGPPQPQPQVQPQQQPQPQFPNTLFNQRPAAPADPFNFGGWAPSFPATTGHTPPGSTSPSPVPRWGNPPRMPMGQPMGQMPQMPMGQMPMGQMPQMPMGQMPQAPMGQMPQAPMGQAQLPQVPPRPQIPRMPQVPTMVPPNPAPQAGMPSPRMSRPNGAAAASGSQPGWKPKPTVTENTFGDILNDVLGRPNPAPGAGPGGNYIPRTLGEMQEARNSREVDPNRSKVEKWIVGKRKNIRALLCSLHTVLWDGTRWQEVQMHQLVSADQVKKCYRKAALAVHPDKLTGTEHEPLAKMVFFELNEAWAQFELEGSKSL